MFQVTILIIFALAAAVGRGLSLPASFRAENSTELSKDFQLNNSLTFWDNGKLLHKRKDPVFYAPEWPQDDSEKQVKKARIDAALAEARELARRVLAHWDETWDIRSRYFGPNYDVSQRVKNVFLGMIEYVDDNPPHPWSATFTESFSKFYIMEKDFQNICGGPAGPLVAYVVNRWNPDNDRVWAMMKVCDRGFDVEKTQQHLPRGSGRGLEHTNEMCERFRASDGVMRVHKLMNNLPAILLHEITHFNLVGFPARADFANKPFNIAKSAYIVDYAPGVLLAYRCWQLGGGENCALNAYSYQWFALEVYWTYECFSYLEHHQSIDTADSICRWRFAPPIGETVGGWDYENPMYPSAPRPPLPPDPDTRQALIPPPGENPE